MRVQRRAILFLALVHLSGGCDLFGPPRDFDGDGALPVEGGDCDDWDPGVHPGADEVCDAIDNDCDGLIDEEDAVDQVLWYGDGDGDGFGLDSATELSCSQPNGYVTTSGDCDDDDGSIHPDAVDIPGDGIDQDCDGYDSVDTGLD